MTTVPVTPIWVIVFELDPAASMLGPDATQPWEEIIYPVVSAMRIRIISDTGNPSDFRAHVLMLIENAVAWRMHFTRLRTATAARTIARVANVFCISWI
jgi:hypothetical protein